MRVNGDLRFKSQRVKMSDRQAFFAAGVSSRAFPAVAIAPTINNTNTPHGHEDLTFCSHPTRNYAQLITDDTMSNPTRTQPSTSRLSTVPSQKPRQLSHLQAQLAQLTANMADLESLMRMTAGQAQDMRGLGGYAGAM